MKSPYEIAWNLINYDSCLTDKRLFELTGISIPEMKILKDKNSIIWFITKRIESLSLVKQVIEEIEQGNPHWEIGGQDESI